MNKLCGLIILFFTYSVGSGQNLVPNPSFEDTIQCPMSINQPITTTFWSSYGGTSDYFNICANYSGCGVSVPYNMAGYQQAATGNAYCGMVTYINPTFGNNIREYLGTQLISPLVIGTKYYVSFKVCLSPGGCFDFNIASDKTGVKFITYNFGYYSVPPVFNSAHVYSDSIIADSVNWTIVTGSFIADSNYNQIMCGNFFSDTSTDILSVGTPEMQAYYIIDDVCVSSDSITCYSTVGINEINHSDLMIFPNPFNDNINITTNLNGSLEVNFFDVSQRKVLTRLFTNSISINTSQLANGIYFYEVRNKNGPDSYRVIKNGKIVKD